MLRSSCELFQLYYLCTVCSLLLDPAITNLSIFLLVISLPLSSIFTISNEYQFEYQLFRLVSKKTSQCGKTPFGNGYGKSSMIYEYIWRSTRVYQKHCFYFQPNCTFIQDTSPTWWSTIII